MPTETLFFLWFITLVFIAGLLWAWYRLRAKANKRPSKSTDWSETSITPESDPASPQVAQFSEEVSLPSPASHVGITVELAEGTRLRLTIEAIPAMGDGRDRQVVEIAGSGEAVRVIGPVGAQTLPLAGQIQPEAPVVPESAQPPIPAAPLPERPGPAIWTVQYRQLAAGLAGAATGLLAVFHRAAEKLNRRLAPLISLTGEVADAGSMPLPSLPVADRFPKYSLVLGGLGLVALSALAWGTAPRQLGGLSLLVAVSGVAITALTFYLGLHEDNPSWLSRNLIRWSAWLSIGTYQLLCLGTGILMVILAGGAAGDGELMVSPAVAVLGWLLGMGYMILGGWQKPTAGHRLSWQVGLTAILLFLLAFTVRAVDTVHIPVALTGDEGNSAFSAIEFIRGDTNNIFKVGWRSFPSMFFYLQSVFISLMGQTIQALRIPSALAGALTVSGTYLVGRSMFGNRAGLLAGLVMAGYHFHLHFSRIGLNNIWDGLWYVITLGALWHGWRNERRASYLLAGLALGMAQYFYTASRLLFLLIPAWLLVMGLLDRPRLKRSLPHLVLMGLVTFASLLPLGLYFSNHPREILGPVRQVTILGPWLGREIDITGKPAWKILLRQVGLGFGAFTFTPLKYWYHPGTPLLRPIPAAFFLLGLFLLAMRPRSPRTLLVGGWLMAVGLTGAFSESTPAAQRYLAGGPLCALVVGYSLDTVISWLARLWPGKMRLVTSAALLLVIFIPIDEARFYFLEYTPNSYLNGKYDFAGYGSAVAQYLANTLQEKSDDWKVYFFGGGRMGYYSIASLPYLTPHIQGTDMEHPWGSPDNPPVEGKDLIFVFLPESATDIPSAQRDYPGGVLTTQNYRDGSILYTMYEYSAP